MPLLQVYWDRPTRARMGLISTFINMAVLGFSIMVVFSVVFVKFSMAETSSIVENLFSRREIRSKTVIHHAWIFGLIGGIFLAYHFVAPIIPYDNSNTQKRWSWGLRALQIHLAITLASFVIAIVTSALAGANMVWKLEENLRTSIERMKISPLLHQIQVEFKCCGANGYHPGIGDVYSCCRPNYVERDCSAGSNWNVEAKIKADMFYSQECPAAVARRFEAYAILITVAFALIAFLKLIDAVLIQFLWTSISYVQTYGVRGHQKAPGYLIPIGKIEQLAAPPLPTAGVLADSTISHQTAPSLRSNPTSKWTSSKDFSKKQRTQSSRKQKNSKSRIVRKLRFK